MDTVKLTFGQGMVGVELTLAEAAALRDYLTARLKRVPRSAQAEAALAIERARREG